MVQFPLYDSRALLGDAGKLSVPRWPNPDADKDFMRRCGRTFARSKAGLRGYFAEEKLCRANRLIRFPKITAAQFLVLSDEDEPVAEAALPRVAYRHLFSDGFYTAKLEVGFYIRPYEQDVVGGNLLAFVEHVLQLPVKVAGSDEVRPLISAGELIASAFQRSTTRHPAKWRKWLWPQRAKSSVRFGPPLVCVETSFLPAHDRFPANPRWVALGNGVVAAWRRRLSEQNYHLVAIAESSKTTDLARNLRLFLNRMHAELACAEFAYRDVESFVPRSKILNLLQEIRDRRLRHISYLSRKIGAAARALRGGAEDDPVEIGSQVLSQIWSGRVQAVAEHADVLALRFAKGGQPSPRPRRRSRILRDVFISYRRRDSGPAAERFVAYCKAAFPNTRIFRDLDSLSPGGIWRRELEDAIDRCSHLIAFVGPNWSGNESAVARISDPLDIVRLEIETAIERRKPILPLVTQGAAFPPTGLPPPLRALAARNPVLLPHDDDFSQVHPALEAFLLDL